jgi:hypothetical protein
LRCWQTVRCSEVLRKSRLIENFHRVDQRRHARRGHGEQLNILGM